jgi:hypothetical protein
MLTRTLINVLTIAAACGGAVADSTTCLTATYTLLLAAHKAGPHSVRVAPCCCCCFCCSPYASTTYMREREPKRKKTQTDELKSL